MTQADWLGMSEIHNVGTCMNGYHCMHIVPSISSIHTSETTITIPICKTVGSMSVFVSTYVYPRKKKTGDLFV